MPVAAQIKVVQKEVMGGRLFAETSSGDKITFAQQHLWFEVG